MKSLVCLLTLDRLYLWSQYAVYICGGIALITGKLVNDRQAEKIETLRRDNLELEAKVSPRRLSGSQKETLIKLLSDDPGNIAIVSSAFDPETSDFADDFEAALREAHWGTIRIRNHTTLEHGVAVGTFEGTSLGDTQRLSGALRAIGVDHQIRDFLAKEANTISPSFEAGVLYLVINHKPTTTAAK